MRPKNPQATLADNTKTLWWIWSVLLSARARRLAFAAVTLMLAAMLATMSVTYLIRFLINAMSEGRNTDALWLLIAVGGLLLVGQCLLTSHDYARELMWNDNYARVITTLSRFFLSRTVAELISEQSEVGAEQIESAKERVRNLLHIIFFDALSVVAAMVSALFLMALVDLVAAGVLCVLILVNLLWFFHYNTTIDAKMEPIDTLFRRANRRLVERWHFALTVKTTGAEALVDQSTQAEVARPLKADRKLWAGWYIWLDLRRSLINSVVILGILAYGIAYAEWKPGDVAAMCTWLFITVEKFGFVGHFMRHFTSEIARLKAVRIFLCNPPTFAHNEGIVYERSTPCTSPSIG